MSLFNRTGCSRTLGTGRAAILTSGLLAAVLAAPAAYSETGGSLRLARNDSGSIVQAIAIKDWRFDAKTGELRVTSQGGARRCGISSGKSTGQTLILDGVRYPLERFRVEGKNEKRLEVTPVIAGEIFPLCVVPRSAPELVSVVGTKGSSSSGLNVELDVLGQPPSDLGVVDGIGYDVFTPPATISLGLTEDVLCLQGPGQDGVRLSITDTNLETTTFQGFQSLDYRPFGGSGSAQPTLRAITDGNPVCLAFPDLAQVVTPQSPAGTCSPSDIFFADGFEQVGSPIGGAASTDLEIDLRLIENPNTTTLQNAVYELVVTNCGDNPASNVVVRDFYPTGSLSGKPTRLGAGSWSCTSGVTCAGGSGYVDVNIGTLDPGATAVINVDRPLTAGAAGNTLQVTASVAELDGNGENDPADNIATWEFDVRDNELPAGTPTGSCTIDEDSGTTNVAAAGCNNAEGFAISVTDSDGTIAAVSAASLNSDILTVVGDPTFSGVGTDTITITGLPVATVADANGPATIRVSVTDNLGGIGTVDLNITVDAVNDPPTITVLGGFDYNGGTPIFAGPNCNQTSASDCADQNYPSDVPVEFEAIFGDWVVAVTPGPADEAGQVTSVSIGAPSNPALFFGTSGRPDLRANEVQGTWDLDYVLSGESGTASVSITVTDDQAGDNTTVFTFDIMVDNSPPVVSVTGAPNTIAEESAGVTLSGGGFFVAASDPEDDAVTISVTSSDQSLVADGDIVVNDADLNDIQITVTTQPNAFGIVDLSVVATDTAASLPGIVSVTVDNVNDAPSVVFAGQASIESDDNVISFSETGPDAATLTLNSTITGIANINSLLVVSGDEALGPFEGGQNILTITPTVTSDPDSIFALAPTFETSGRLNFALSGSNGTATVEIVVVDDGGTSGGGEDTSTTATLTVVAATP